MDKSRCSFIVFYDDHNDQIYYRYSLEDLLNINSDQFDFKKSISFLFKSFNNKTLKLLLALLSKVF
jgi:hypothetical protein